MRRPLASFPVGLQAVTQLAQQFRDQAVANLMPLAVEFVRKPTRALAGPAQRRLWIATTHRFDQLLQIVQQGRIYVNRPLAPTAGAADTLAEGGIWRGQFLEAVSYGPR